MKNIFASGKIKALEVVKLSIGGYLLYLGINFIASMLIVFTGIRIYGWQIGERILPFIDKNIFSLSSNINIGIIVFIIVLIIPLIEEILFRGLLLNYIVDCIGNQSKEFFKKYKNYLSTILSSVIYALLTATLFAGFNHILVTFVFGVIASAITIKSESLYPAIILHIFGNLVGIIIEIFLFKI